MEANNNNNNTVNTNTSTVDLRWVGPIEANMQQPSPCKGEECDCCGSQWGATCDPTYRGVTPVSWIMQTPDGGFTTVSGRPIRLERRGLKTLAWYGIEKRPSNLACQIGAVNPNATGLFPGESADGRNGNWCPVLRHENGAVLHREYRENGYEWIVSTGRVVGTRVHRILVDQAWSDWRQVMPSLPRHAAGKWY